MPIDANELVPSLWATLTQPAPTNTWALGSASLAWANLYLGPGGAPAFDPVSGNIGYYARTAAEAAAGVTPVNYVYPPGYVDRYATNTTPGTTDMGPALQAAINLALATVGSGAAGVPTRFGAGAYRIATKPTFGATTTNIIPIDIGGVGYGTQVICDFASGSALFDMTGKNGWRIHDMLICGNSAHKNNGIAVDQTGNAQAIEWEIENVLSLMCGVGFYLSNTNTGTIRNCLHWPGNNPALIIPQTVTFSDVSHGCYMTGGFVHNVTLIDFVNPPNSNYNAANVGIKIDATASVGVTIIRPLVQTGSGSNNEVGISAVSSGSIQSLTMIGIYNEGTSIVLGSVGQSVIAGATDGDSLGTFQLNAGSRQNTISGVNQNSILVTDSSAWGNVFSGCIARAAFSDSTEGANLSFQPNRYIGCTLWNSSAQVQVPDLGNTWRKTFGPGTTFAPDVYSATWNVFRAQAATLTVSAPLHPRNGQRVGFTIRNETAGAITVTWSGFGSPPWTNPATTFNRSAEYMYDSDFGEWRQLWFSGADVPN